MLLLLDAMIFFIYTQNLIGNITLSRVIISVASVKGPSIKYVTLFLANFYPPSPCHTSSHIPGPLRKYVTHLGPPRFLEGLVQKTRRKALCTNSVSIVRGGFCPEGFVSGSFVWKVLFGVVFVRSCSVRIHLLHQKVKHHFKFHVSYV